MFIYIHTNMFNYQLVFKNTNSKAALELDIFLYNIGLFVIKIIHKNIYVFMSDVTFICTKMYFSFTYERACSADHVSSTY